jgi:hypothetical protein
MRKRLISSPPKTDSTPADQWLELEQAAQVEVSSEADGYPVEGALLPHQERGWRAATAGIQTIRLLFDEPQTIRTIRLLFKEEQAPRTQEFLLRWLPHGTTSWKEVVRQQWNFSPPNTAEELEEYQVNLVSTAALELSINPDVSQEGAGASLQRMQVSVRERP